MNQPLCNRICEEVRRQLDPYLDRELPAQAQSEFLRHLENCPDCAADAAARETLKLRLRSAVGAQVPDPRLAVRVVRRLEEEPATPWWSLRWFAVPGWAMALALVLVVVGGGMWYSLRPPGLPPLDDPAAQAAFIRRISTRIAGVMRSGLADHVHCAIFRRYAAHGPSAAEMLAELGRYRDLLPVVKAAIPADWRVVMAHQCAYQDRHYVHVILRDEAGRVVSLVITRRREGESFAALAPARTVEGVGIYTAEAGQFRIAGFEAGGYLAFVVSEQDPARNLDSAARLLGGVSRVLAGNL